MNKLISTSSVCQENGLWSLSRVLQLFLASVFVLFLTNTELNAQCQTCCNGSKPKSLVLKYNGLPCSASVTCQADGKWSCSGAGPNNAASVYITASKNSDGSGGTYFAGTVLLNAEFTPTSAAGGSSTFPSNTFFNVYSSQGGTLLQAIKIHTSCSTPLVAGDQFGSLFLKTITLADNTACNATPPPPPGCNNITCGGEIMDNETKCSPFDPTIITEATPPCGSGDMNCFKIDPPVSGSSNGVTYTVTSVNGQPKTLTVTGTGILKVIVKGGPNSVMYTTAPFTNLTAPVNPNNGQPYDISHFIICVSTIPPPPAVDCCNGSKPKSSILMYTGQGCSASNTTQPLGTKYNCTDLGGGPNNDPSVYITVGQNLDGTGGTYFAGNVAINTTFTINSISGGSSTFPSNVYFNVYASQGGTLLQKIQIHYSCSAPLVPGEQFGSLVLKGVTFADNTSCGEGSTGGGGTGGTDCCNGSKPKSSILKYTGQGCSASNTTQPLGTKYNCADLGGGPNGDPSVYITVSKNSDGTGGTYFAGNVAINGTFTINSISGGSSTFPSNVYFNVYASQGGTLLQKVQIHYSCSAPLVPGEQFGSLVLQNVTFADNTVCGLPTTTSGDNIEYRWLRSTTACPTSASQIIAGATGATYDPPSISQTTWYVRQARRVGCTADNEWLSSNCIIKRVVNINATITNKICDGKGTASTADDTYTFVLTVTGGPGGGGWTGSFDNAYLGVFQIGETPYGTPITLGPFPAGQFTPGNVFPPPTFQNGVDINVHVSDAQLASCKSDIVVVSTGPCSPNYPPASLGNFVWNDLNQNGVQNAGEPGVPGVAVKLYKCDGTFVSQQNTDVNGGYLFDNLAPNMQYFVEFSGLPAGFQFSPRDAAADNIDSDPNTTTGRTDCTFLSPAEVDLTVDAGIFTPTPQLGSLGDFVWNDLDQDGVQDPGEPGVPNVTVQLKNCSNVVLTSTTTSATGFYSFNNLAANCYRVGVVLPGGFQFSPQNVGNDATDSDINPGTAMTGDINLAPGQNDPTNDAGIYQPVTQTACVGDFVWRDNNGNGIQDLGEPGIGGVLVFLEKCDGTPVSSKTTDNNGFYLFCNLTPGDYRIRFTPPGTFTISPQNAGTDDCKDSDMNLSGVTACFNLSPGETDLCVDGGFTPPPPACTINLAVSNIICDGKGTPTTTDDTYTFVITVTGTGTGSTWQGGYSHGCLGALSIGPAPYNTPITLGPFPAGEISCGLPFPTLYPNGLNINVSVLDTQNPNCTTSTTVQSPGPCSQAAPASVGDYVWRDNNNNGIQDPGEPGVQGVLVKLFRCDNTFIGQFTTNANGFYQFVNLTPGSYYVQFSNLPAGFVFSTKDAGTDDSKDSDANTTTGNTDCFNLASGQYDPTRDAGIKQSTNTGPGAVGDFVWFDTNANGIQEPGEPGIPNVFVILETCTGAFVNFATTNAQGQYLITNVPAGQYRVKFASPGTFNGVPVSLTVQNAGNDDTKDSDADWLGFTACFTLNAGETNLTLDAGFTGETPPPVCVINGNASNVVCSNGQFTFTLIMNGTNTGAWGYDIPALGLYTLQYGQPYVLGPFPGGSPVTLAINDHDVANCTTTLTVQSPANCGGGGTGNPCDGVSFSGNGSKITVSGLTSPIEIVKVFNASWQTVYECSATCANPTVTGNLPAGTYFVKVQMFSATWSLICTKEGYVIVSAFTGNNGDEAVSDGPAGNSTDDTTAQPVDASANHSIGDAAIQHGQEKPTAPTQDGQGDELHLFPNPAGGSTVIQWGFGATWQQAELRLLNQLGQTVKTVKLADASAGSYRLDLDGLRNGQYFVQFLPEGKLPVTKRLTIIQ